jgi:hypothetical protein
VRGLKEGLKCNVIQQMFKHSRYFNDFVIFNHDNPSPSSKLYVIKFGNEHEKEASNIKYTLNVKYGMISGFTYNHIRNYMDILN